ncbi:MAG: glycerophosphodiester phosphodiesterase family protein [Paracoccus sp. (in: a-proteobacteria)]|uniref:glycerophosphodiester phosphodiesterase family protein n=1 Tax=Paracoccus sp. TaxID=267 RepID=UPI0026DFAA1B|nr:glycerophosphodiester phosphodiesterase family protein [Paracoccus sp. (in: a-proteobacteria)]MDO5630710.1 glycerophosphodiester phosphodiesterase family protein [Paracoccus sp. (in: a-proteobacteria)]
MPAPLPAVFLDRPVAHRGLHGPGVPENSLAAARAAIVAGYGIELDIQPSASGQALVFHDYDLARLTGQRGFIHDRDGDDLAALRLMGSDQAVPTLRAFLDLVAGQVPLLIEIKDQDTRLGPNIGALHQAVADDLAGYDGPVAVMSFNPHVVAGFHALAPQIACGLTTCGYTADDWPMIDAARRAHLAEIADFDASGSSFVSHDHADLDNPAVAALKTRGVPVLCWTIRSKAQEAAARRIADNITFEGYAA